MVVNVCPAAVTSAPPDRVWRVLTTLPFGIDNHEHVTLTDTKEGGTLVRFN